MDMHSQSGASSDVTRGILLPIETWKSIFSFLCQQTREDITGTRDLLSLSRTCSAFQFEAESILYHHVRLTQSPAQLLTFASAVANYVHRAEAVRALYLQLSDYDSYRLDGVKKTVLQRLPNLKSLHIDRLEDPHDVLVHSPFRLRSFGINGRVFVRLHSEGHRRMSKIEGCPEESDVASRCEFLSELTTLTLYQNYRSTTLLDALQNYCTPYNITYLNIVSSLIRFKDRSSLYALADQLVSLRLHSVSGRSPPHTMERTYPWPINAVMDHVFPRLEYLELDEDSYIQKFLC
ncbi:hypothetical protein L227DRAFT_616549 [Lentinus tigrinus ALCF2SS1-6]|uniref:F-box domain-containing protein n=1 Tax=Lentinus tigrinus ALCF2SS1-6 TaxID=1328759 RepID=A0A5C2RQQ1_9APHY|nr:hypothetical protein L227DRAFT_616549 [Lentinus tigrinus ALCF2SS1-6]